MSRRLPVGLYGIADTGFGDPCHLARQLVHGGARVIQLRAKDWTTAQRIHAGRALVEHFRPLGVLFIMNDDLDAAVAVGADGLHLGQDDGDLASARVVLGPSAILGRSTHSAAQATAAEAEVDYIGFGPVFATTTKRAAGTLEDSRSWPKLSLQSRFLWWPSVAFDCSTFRSLKRQALNIGLSSPTFFATRDRQRWPGVSS